MDVQYESEIRSVRVGWIGVVKHAESDAKWKRGGGCSCLAFARAGLGYLYVKSEMKEYNLCYAEKGASGGGETERK